MKTTFADYFFCTVCITLLLVLSFTTTSTLSIRSLYHVVLDVAVFFLAYGLYTTLLLAIVRRVFPYPVGRFSMESREFTYWKLVAVLTDLGQKALGPFTTVFSEPLIHMLFGAKIGKQVAIAAVIRDHPLIIFGDRATMGQHSVITAHAITHNEIVLAPVHIGNNAVVGINCVVMPGVTIGDCAVLAPGSVATIDTKIPANELWGGTPARKIKDLIPLSDSDSNLLISVVSRQPPQH